MASPNSLIAVTVWLFYFSKVVLGNEECVAFGPKTCIEKYSSSKWRMDCKIHISCDNINIPPGNHQFLSESLNNAFITAETTGSNDYDISVRNTAVWHHILANETIGRQCLKPLAIYHIQNMGKNWLYRILAYQCNDVGRVFELRHNRCRIYANRP